MPKKDDGAEKKERAARHTFYHNGKQYETTGKTKAEAIKKAALKEAALERGEVGISGKMSVRRWGEEWLAIYKAGTITDKSYATYARHVALLVDDIGNMKIKDVRDAHLQKIINKRSGFSKSDTVKLRNTIQAVFKRARISRLIPFDPAEELEMPKTTQGKRRSITDIERRWILETAETHHAGLWVKVMLYCGLRPGEIIALQWRDLDFKEMLIKITKAKESGNNDIKAPKTDAGMREVPIPDILLPDLKAAKRDPFQPVFTQLTTPLPHTESSFYCAWGNFLREMDIAMGAKVYRNQIKISMVAPDLSPYCLRHTYCTDLEAAGVPINVAKYLMGHSDISVTANIYTHTTKKIIAAAAAQINAANNIDNGKDNGNDSNNIKIIAPLSHKEKYG